MYVPEILTEIGFNKRQMTFADFEFVCEKLKIRYFFTKASFDGVSFPRRKSLVIVLNQNLKGLDLLLIAWHELFHLLCGHKGVRFFIRGSLDKAERQADALALCAMMPKTWIEQEKPIHEILEEGFTWQQIWERRDIYDSHNKQL